MLNTTLGLRIKSSTQPWKNVSICYVTMATCKAQCTVKRYVSVITMLVKILINYTGIVITFCLDMRSFKNVELLLPFLNWELAVLTGC